MCEAKAEHCGSGRQKVSLHNEIKAFLGNSLTYMGFVHPLGAVAQETMEKLTSYVFEGTCHSETSV
jgi:hypothetical protein